MNKLVLYLTIVLTNYCWSQNLVPNPSFEGIMSCPIMESQIYLAEPWFSPYLCSGGTFESCSSSDLYNECFTPPGVSINVDVPNNVYGYQPARTGVGYAGIAIWMSNGWRERIQVPLLETLKKDSVYCVKMFVMNKRSIPGIPGGTDLLASTANIQFLFTEDTLVDNYPFPQISPSVWNDDETIIDDTLNWTVISGCYLSNGTENYLTIGDFYNNTNSNVTDANKDAAYYFIDDVSVEKYDGANCSCSEFEYLFPDYTYDLPNVFTPDGDLNNDYWTTNFLEENEYIIILNRWGNEIITLTMDNPTWDGLFNGKQAMEGIYFYRSFLRGETKTGFIHLVR